jgi:hypothetical protein
MSGSNFGRHFFIAGIGSTAMLVAAEAYCLAVTPGNAGRPDIVVLPATTMASITLSGGPATAVKIDTVSDEERVMPAASNGENLCSK